MQVKGHVEAGGSKLDYPRLHGKWDAALMATFDDGSEQLLWQKNPPHKHPSRSAQCNAWMSARKPSC